MEGRETVGRIVAAIPAYNEEVAIGSAVLKSKKHTDEVIVVDDGSSDATAEIAAAAGATVLRHATNLGKGAAIQTVLEYARKDGVGILVLHDADMQHDPAEIPSLIQPIIDGRADVVIGTRHTNLSGMPLYRRAGKRILDYATAVASGEGAIKDSQNGFRAFSRRAIESLMPKVTGIGIESEMLVTAIHQGLRLVEVPVSVRYDVDGSTFNPAKHGMRVLGTLITLVSQKRPLFFFGLTGLALLTVAALFAISTIQIYYTTKLFVIGYAFLFLLFAIVGVLCIFTGIVLNALTQLMAPGKYNKQAKVVAASSLAVAGDRALVAEPAK